MPGRTSRLGQSLVGPRQPFGLTEFHAWEAPFLGLRRPLSAPELRVQARATVVTQRNRAGGGGGPVGPLHSVGSTRQPRPGGGMAGD